MENMGNVLTAVAAEEGQCVSVIGDTYRIIVTGEHTGGAFTAIDMLVPPGGGPGPHSHAAIQESFYVMEGEIEVKTETRKYMAGKGSFINIPKGGMVHCFKSVSQTTAHLLCLVTPAGLDQFFLEIGKPVAAGTFLPPPEMGSEELNRLRSIAEQYGQKLYPPDYLG